VPGVCSITQKSLLTLLPSIWCAAVAVPQVNPFGKRMPIGPGFSRAAGECKAFNAETAKGAKAR
jgi:hypothetical protein